MLRKIKNLLKPLMSTPMHPQWFAARHQERIKGILQEEIKGPVVLDIGCGTKWPLALLPASCRYVGLDYPDTAQWYATKPDVFGEAQNLPFASGSMNTALMLDVLEHVPDSRKALLEASRCLVEKGRLVLLVPFMYPLHDAPHDYGRWTAYGLKKLAGESGFEIEKETYNGNPLETAALLSNIAMTKTVFNWISKRHMASVLVLLLPIYVLASNLLAWLLCKIAPADALMPISYQMVLKKK